MWRRHRRCTARSGSGETKSTWVLGGVAESWDTPSLRANDVEQLAAAALGERADDVLHGPGSRLGPPWTKDHRMALAATIVAG